MKVASTPVISEMAVYATELLTVREAENISNIYSWKWLLRMTIREMITINQQMLMQYEREQHQSNHVEKEKQVLKKKTDT